MKKSISFVTLCFVIHLLVGWFSTSHAQISEFPKYENRAVFMATVFRLDFPDIVSGRFQKQELMDKFDEFKAAGINTIYFQIRTECDAFYDSNYEPWSAFLTGQEGVPPSPYFDPLEFAIQEAHKRGMELHGWMNPYRAIINTGNGKVTVREMEMFPDHFFQGVEAYTPEDIINQAFPSTQRSNEHISVTHPEWLLIVGPKGILNPGLPEVIDYITDVVMDVVNRYDVDGIHFDDYFYPYPPDHMSSSLDYNALDDSTFIKYPRGYSNKSDWRRNNINLMIESVYDSIQTVKPHVEFGVSPFGIWKEGTPNLASGMSAFNIIYADAVTWMDSLYVDYLAPQLYWPFNRFSSGQDFGLLADWWGTVRNGRHMYTSHGVYRADRGTFSGELIGANEIPRQIRYMRDNADLTGSIHFRAKNITFYNTKGFVDSLQRNLYHYPALPPSMDWKPSMRPPTPENFAVSVDNAGDAEQVELSWSKAPYSNGLDSLQKFVVYRVESEEKPLVDTVMTKHYYIRDIIGGTSFVDNPPPTETNLWYFVTSANRNSEESEPTEVINAGQIVTSSEEIDEILPQQFELGQNYPNPFNPSTVIPFSIESSDWVTLNVYDINGRKVAELVNETRAAGRHSVRFNATNLASGVYFYRLTANGKSATQRLVLIK